MSAKTKFTPGPWRVDDSCEPVEIVGPAKNYRRFGGENERTLGAVGDDCWDESEEDERGLMREDRANAHLIAAAPELYEALKEICSEFAQSHPLIVAGRAALAKARGETP